MSAGNKKKTLLTFLQQNIDWLCSNTFVKKCEKDCWYHCFLLELEFVIEKKLFLASVKSQVIVNRIITKYEKRNCPEFFYYFD